MIQARRFLNGDGGQYVTLRCALLVFALIGALVVHLVWDVSLGIALLIFFVGWPIVGAMVTIDDDLPGGWSNPDGTARPDWLEAEFWGQIVIGVAISVVGVSRLTRAGDRLPGCACGRWRLRLVLWAPR